MIICASISQKTYCPWSLVGNWPHVTRHWRGKAKELKRHTLNDFKSAENTNSKQRNTKLNLGRVFYYYYLNSLVKWSFIPILIIIFCLFRNTATFLRCLSELPMQKLNRFAANKKSSTTYFLSVYLWLVRGRFIKFVNYKPTVGQR